MVLAEEGTNNGSAFINASKCNFLLWQEPKLMSNPVTIFFLSTPHHDLKKAHNLRKWAQLHWYLGGPFGNGKSATHHIFISFISFQPPLLFWTKKKTPSLVDKKKTPLFDKKNLSH